MFSYFRDSLHRLSVFCGRQHFTPVVVIEDVAITIASYLAMHIFILSYKHCAEIGHIVIIAHCVEYNIDYYKTQ